MTKHPTVRLFPIAGIALLLLISPVLADLTEFELPGNNTNTTGTFQYANRISSDWFTTIMTLMIGGVVVLSFSGMPTHIVFTFTGLIMSLVAVQFFRMELLNRTTLFMFALLLLIGAGAIMYRKTE